MQTGRTHSSRIERVPFESASALLQNHLTSLRGDQPQSGHQMRGPEES
jgi:hypothetical protein